MPPRTPQEPVQKTYSNQKLWRALQAEYGGKSLRNWSDAISVKHQVRLTHGTLHRALNGVEPRRSDLRQALGLPALALATVCPACGVVHLSKRCPNKRKPARARTNWKRLALVFAGLIANGRGQH